MQVLRESGAELVTFQLNVKQDNFQSLEKKRKCIFRACGAFLCNFTCCGCCLALAAKLFAPLGIKKTCVTELSLQSCQKMVQDATFSVKTGTIFCCFPVVFVDEIYETVSLFSPVTISQL